MSKYIRKFSTLSEVNNVKYSESYYEPSVYQIGNKENALIKYNEESNYLTVKIDTSLLSNNSDALWTIYNGDIFDEILIDDVKWNTPMTPATKADIEVGKHVLKIKFKDNTKIGSTAPLFNGAHIINIYIPSNFKTLCNNVFYNCSSLNNVRFTESLISIGSYAFLDCRSIDKIFIHQNLTLDNYAFSNTQIKEVYLDKINGSLITNNIYPSHIKKIIIGPNITQIPISYFSGIPNLEEVIIQSNKILEIPENAFRGCNKLVKINIPESISSIGSDAFAGCYILGYEKNGIRYLNTHNKNLGTIVIG